MNIFTCRKPSVMISSEGPTGREVVDSKTLFKWQKTKGGI